MTEQFKFIDDERVPPAIKPMTELHDKLVRGYSEEKELRVPKLIESLEIRITTQVEELVKLENEIQTGHQQVQKIFGIIRKIALDESIPKVLSDDLMDELDNVYV